MKQLCGLVLSLAVLVSGAAKVCAEDRVGVEELARRLNAGMRPEKLDSASVRAIFTLMNDRTESAGTSLATIPKLMFGSIYDPALADLVMCLPNPGTNPPAIALVQGGKAKSELFGQKYVWALLFWKRPAEAGSAIEVADSMSAVLDGFVPGAKTLYALNHVRTIKGVAKENKVDERVAALIDSTLAAASVLAAPPATIRHTFGFHASGGDPDSATFRLEPLVYEEESVDRSLLGGLLSILNFGERKEPEKVEDEELSSPAFVLGEAGSDQLVCSVQKFTIRENSVNRIKGEAESQKEYATFGNYDASRYGVSVGINAGKDYTRPDSQDTTKAPDATKTALTTWVTKPFVYLHLYAKRPRLPRLAKRNHWYSVSLRLTVGTEFTTKFDRWYAGIGAGNLIGRLGLSGGVRVRRGQSRWVFGRNLAFGLDYTL